MPVYEYYCEPCDGVFETIRMMKESGEPAPCPECEGAAERIMPTSFSAFVMRGGYPRRLPDRGTYWHLGKEVKEKPRGVAPNEHQELIKPRPKPALSKGEKAARRDWTRDERARTQRLKKEVKPGERPPAAPRRPKLR
ncbi:MAG: hypothetical protein GEU28_12710 [Dehalococcoidia bacterium]|nr:hypothetical protein [Dehalococcoidia bacterium]